MSVNVSLFGNWVFANIIKLRRGHSGLGWTKVLLRTEKIGYKQRGAQGEPHVMTEAETGLTSCKSRKIKDFPFPAEPRRDKEGFFPRAFRETMALIAS